jgi:hypothetical protein
VHGLLSLLHALAIATLPEPPHQHGPWAPPEGHGFPQGIIDVTARLFDVGLADPRGGEYRMIEIEGGRAKRSTHGWVFPNKLAVCWDGLVYAPTSIGDPADLNRDAKAIIDFGPWKFTPFVRLPFPSEQGFWVHIRPGSASSGELVVSLLLRAGRVDLAKDLWSSALSDERSWAAAVATSWLGAAYLRVVRERIAGEDQNAVDTAESALLWQPRVAELLPPGDRSQNLAFLKPLPLLFADSRRRLGHAKRELLRKGEEVSTPDLIDRLEDVYGDKLMWPGPLFYEGDPVVDRLVEKGTAAVDALLDTLESDDRLTRTVDYGRPWQLQRTPISVREIARIILGRILHLPPKLAEASPAELRAWWSKHNIDDLIQRSFQILANDSGTPEEWATSAEVIAQRSDISSGASGDKWHATGACDPRKPVPPLRAEPLRGRVNPSVKELLMRRTAELVARQQDALACRVAFMAYLWNPQTAPSALRLVSDRAECQKDSAVTAARIASGDPVAARQWVQAVLLEMDRPGAFPSDLSPLWMFPNDPALAEFARRLFEESDSKVSRWVQPYGISSPSLAIPAFRRSVFDALRDNTVVGTATRAAEGRISYSFKNGGGSYGTDPNDAPQLRPGEERAVRRKDVAAFDLSMIDGFPKFRPDWPIAEKNRAIEEIATFLAAHQTDLQPFPAKIEELACGVSFIYLSGHKLPVDPL